jgi:hypothetical protein
MMPIEEGTPGKWSLLATHSQRFGAVAELHASADVAEARAAALRLAGYTVDVTLLKLATGG